MYPEEGEERQNAEQNTKETEDSKQRNRDAE